MQADGLTKENARLQAKLRMVEEEQRLEKERTRKRRRVEEANATRMVLLEGRNKVLETSQATNADDVKRLREQLVTTKRHLTQLKLDAITKHK